MKEKYIREREQYILALEAKVSRLEQEIAAARSQQHVVRDLSESINPEEIFHKAFYNNQTMMAISRVNDGVFIDVNNSFAENLGYTREQLLGKSLLDLGLWIDLKDRQLLYDHLFQFGFAKNKEYKFRGAKDIIIDVIASGNLLDFNGDMCLITSLINITDRKKAETELKSSKDKFFNVFNDSQSMMAIVTLNEGRFIDVNDKALSVFGYSKEEILGFSLRDKGLWADLKVRDVMLDLLATQGFLENYECTLKHKSGQEITMMCSINLILIDDLKCMIVSGSDITALRKYQKEFLRLDNLNLIGQMAASIAHEVRNPMTSIKGFLQLFKNQYKYQEDHAVMELMIEELDRVNDIISTFLSLAHKNQIEVRLHRLNDCITNVLPLIMADALKNDIYLETDLGDQPMVMIDEGEIRQLLMNLARNSIQAMPCGGTLTVKTFADMNGAHLVVQDNGTGIPPEVIDKIGTPFFTTKDNGSGLGLGVQYCRAAQGPDNI